MSDAELRDRVIEVARRMNTLGINQGKSGNVSARADGGFLVTPTAIPYERLRAADIVLVRSDGSWADGEPSSEWRFHRDIYDARLEAHAIVHTHSPHATTLACLRRGIPAFHYEVAMVGGADIRCSEYATFGTQELSDLALAALAGRRACLLGNHGVIAIGADLEGALAMADKVEALARMYWQALQVGEPVLLDAAEMARVAGKFANYGKQ